LSVSPKADASYWTVTFVGYDRPMKINKFNFLYMKKQYRPMRKFTEELYSSTRYTIHHIVLKHVTYIK
jgi:hypothetical protein